MAFINSIAALSSVRINKWIFNSSGQDKRQVLGVKSRRRVRAGPQNYSPRQRGLIPACDWPELCGDRDALRPGEHTCDPAQGLDVMFFWNICEGKHPSVFTATEAETHHLILGEQVGDVLMPPLRCFFLGDRADCCSSSTTETPETLWDTQLTRTRTDHTKMTSIYSLSRCSHLFLLIQ